jgi:hypothetical protein
LWAILRAASIQGIYKIRRFTPARLASVGANRLEAGGHPVYYFRSGSGIPVPVGGGVRQAWRNRLLVDGGFLAVLTVGFAYEWKKGALEWY